MKVIEIIAVLFFGFIGQLGCWVLMIGGQSITTLDNALVIHAIGAPIVFALVSFVYFKKLNYTTPQSQALRFWPLLYLWIFSSSLF